LTVKVNRIIDDGMNKMKEIINAYPKGVWAGNIFCLMLGLAVILFV